MGHKENGFYVSLPQNKEDYIFKPIRANHKMYFRSVLSSLMSRFQDLYTYNGGEIIENVVFPIGVIGYPKTSQLKVKSYLDERFKELWLLKELHFDLDLTSGNPVVVYAKLGSEWKRGDQLLEESETI